MRRATSQRARALIPNHGLAVDFDHLRILCLEFGVFVMTYEVVPLAVSVLSRQAMEDRHFIHKTAKLAVGTRITTGFQQQHLEAGTRKMSGQWSTTGARADHDVVKLCSAHFESAFVFSVQPLCPLCLCG